MNFALWNSQGWGEEKAASILEFVRNQGVEIILVTETWAKPKEKLKCIEGFVSFEQPRSFKHQAAWRGAGGLAVWISKELATLGVSQWRPGSAESHMWLRLLGLGSAGQDVYL